METYILLPRDPTDFDLLINTMRPERDDEDIDLVVGVRGPLAPPDMCNGLMIPIVRFDNIYAFSRTDLLMDMQPPAGVSVDAFRTRSSEIYDLVTQIADNAGATDVHRALNFLAVRYAEIYNETARAAERDESPTSVEVIDSRISSTRRLVNVIFSFTNRKTGVVSKYFARVDVTEEFPFLQEPLKPYLEATI